MFFAFVLKHVCSLSTILTRRYELLCSIACSKKCAKWHLETIAVICEREKETHCCYVKGTMEQLPLWIKCKCKNRTQRSFDFWVHCGKTNHVVKKNWMVALRAKLLNFPLYIICYIYYDFNVTSECGVSGKIWNY